MTERRRRMSIEDVEAALVELTDEELDDLLGRVISQRTGVDGDDSAWLAELNRRIDEVEAGTARTIPVEAVFARMRERRDGRSLPS